MDKFIKCLALQLFCALNIHGQLVINEILFNPVKEGFDYVEIYNRGTTNINLRDLLIANRNFANEIASVKPVSKDSITLAPGQYFVLTGNVNWLRQHYTVPDAVTIIQMSLPSFPDDEGCVVLLRKSDSLVIDEVTYNENWHFEMIADPQGVALERISYDLPSQDKNNWTSASSPAGFGTPGYVNSQFRNSVSGDEQISIVPAVLTPDNDGQNDFASITIKTQQPGRIVNAVVFNAMGRRVRYLLKNETLGVNNRFTWDGYDDKDQLLPSGIYIIFMQIFDTKGTIMKFRSCIVLNSFPP